METGNTKRANRSKRGRIFIYGVIIIIAIVVIALITKGEDYPSVYVTHPQKRSIVEKIPANGRVRPSLEVVIAPDVSGEIVQLLCKEGDIVKKGDVLIKIKPDVYISILDQATAILNSAKARYKEQEARYNLATLTYQRKEKLYLSKAITQSEYEIAQADYQVALSTQEAAKYDIQSATASVMEAKENLKRTTIYSPMDGVVSRVMVEQGERVVGTSQMAGTEMICIADFTQMEVLVDVNEKDIPKVEVGDTAKIEIDAFRGSEIFGVVTHIANSSENSPYSGEYLAQFKVRIKIIDHPRKLRPGMTASVSIVTDKKDNIITIPLGCIKSNGCIFVVEESGSSSPYVKERRISTGIQDMHYIEITDGITDSDLIVYAPYEAINKTLKSNGKIYINRD